MRLKLPFAGICLCAGLLACRFGPSESVLTGLSDVRSNALPAHQTHFSLVFRGDRVWSYALETVITDGAIGRDLDIDGVPLSVSPGDVRLIMEGDQVRMTGQATEGECWIFPADNDLERSFLTPESFFGPDSLRLTKLEEVGTVAGREAQRYSVQELEGSQWQEVSGELWLDVETEAVLRMDFSARGQDPFFGAGSGLVEGTYQVTGIGEQQVEPIAGCDIPFPLPPNSSEIVYVEDFLAFATPQSRPAVIQFYQRGLAEQGWTLVSEPQAGEFGTTMTFQRDGVLLEITVREGANQSEVEIFTEPAS